MSGLRERQKADRGQKILAAARRLFGSAGLDATTIEAIAEAAEVSSMTVHNYFGTKSGVLLALVTESDRELLQKIDRELPKRAQSLTALVRGFGALIREHAITFLDKRIWRQVIAASITEADSRFAQFYHALDHELARTLVNAIAELQRSGKLAPEVSAQDLGLALFALQNARFIEFVGSDQFTDAEADALLARDLAAILAVRAADGAA